MRLLIFLFALTSAFFVSAEPDLSDLLPPNGKTDFCISAYSFDSCGRTLMEASMNACNAYGVQSLPSSSSSRRYTKHECFFKTGEQIPTLRYYGVSSCPACSGGWGPEEVSAYQPINWSNQREELIYKCPPDYSPEHDIVIPDDSHPSGFMCAKLKKPKDCPAGYHSKAVSKAIGGSECVPKDCPAAGSGEALSSSPATGGVPFSGGGMYCNDGCAYSVPASNITSQNYASGTSQGVACGDKPYDNKKLAEEGDEGGCKTTTNVDGVSVLTCDKPAEQPKPVDDKPNNDDSKVDDTEKPKKPYEDCAIDDSACMLRNLKTASENSSQEAIDNDNKLHNKMVDTVTKNTNVLKSSIENLDTTVYLAHQENVRNDTLKIQKLSGIIDAINGIETGGGGGGGGGNGGGTGTGEGEGEGDCAGSATDCVPIGDSEIPVETVNLQQYSDKYDDWLPNAELPEKKCIVLTTGKSLCLSLEAFIIFFKAISGLMVIGALMHSAKIIAGAV